MTSNLQQRIADFLDTIPGEEAAALKTEIVRGSGEYVVLASRMTEQRPGRPLSEIILAHVPDNPVTPFAVWERNVGTDCRYDGDYHGDISEAANAYRIRAKIALDESMAEREKLRTQGLRWDNADFIQSASNPSGVALSLHNACREVLAEGGNQRQDAAVRLITYQLAYLMGVREIDDSLTLYGQLINQCRAKAAEIKAAAKG